MGLTEIISLSREYGSDGRYVIAGGGNTSFKDDEFLHIKASGFALATIDESGFVAMERKKLNGIWDKEYPSESAARESTALADLMAAKAVGQEEKRPSVETLLHEAIPDRYIVHTHPALINGLTCSRDGKSAMERLFGDSALWIPIVNPGYVLAVTVRKALKSFVGTTGVNPEYIFLQNHGVFVSGDTPEEIREKYSRLFSTVEGAVTRAPDRGAAVSAERPPEEIAMILRKAFAAVSESSYVIRHVNDKDIQAMLQDQSSFMPVSSAFTPDHIVYCGHAPLYLEATPDGVESANEILISYRAEHGVLPKLIALRGSGIYGCGQNQIAADNSAAMFGDAVNIAVYAESFGGGSPMPQEHIDFIRGWEVEHYRTKISMRDREAKI